METDEPQPRREEQAGENNAVLTPDTPCSVCGAEHNPDQGVVVGRVDEESDIPYGLVDVDVMDEWQDPHEESFCNECIADYLLDLQEWVKILNPRQSEAAGFLLLGVELADAIDIINNRPDDSVGYKGVEDYRTRARRHTLEAMDVISAVFPILYGPSRDKYIADPLPEQDTGDDRHWLTRITGLGDAKAEALREAGFDTKEDVREASQNDLTQIKGVGNALAERIKDTAERGESDEEGVVA